VSAFSRPSWREKVPDRADEGRYAPVLKVCVGERLVGMSPEQTPLPGYAVHSWPQVVAGEKGEASSNAAYPLRIA
jgi:hypothetical protein